MSYEYIMGGSESTVAIESLSEAISNVAVSTVQSCETSSTQDQDLTVINSGFRLWGSYKLDQQSEIRADCFNDVNKQIQLQNRIIDTISQASSSSNIALLGAFGKSNSTAKTNLSNIIRNNVTMSNIQRSYTAIKQTQKATFINSGVIGFEQVELTQGAKLFAAATLLEVDKAGVFNTVESHIDQTSSATMENPLDFIAKAIGAVTEGITSTIILFVVIIAIAVGAFVLVLKAAGDSDIPMPPQLRGASIAAKAL